MLPKPPFTAVPSSKVQDPLFAKVAELVPGIGAEESDEEFDLAAMMAKQRAQAASLHQEAQKLRAAEPKYALVLLHIGFACKLLDPAWQRRLALPAAQIRSCNASKLVNVVFRAGT